MAHPTNSTLESYALSRLHGRSAHTLEKHLLVCPACRIRLSHEDEVLSLIRLGLSPKTAFGTVQRARDPKILPFRTHLPLYSLEAAAGKFGKQQTAVAPEGWIKVPPGHVPLTRGTFVAHIKGRSMEPTIPDGSLCAFKSRVSKPYDGKVLLMEQFVATGGNRYTVKRYRPSQEADPHKKGDREWLHERITLEALNPDYPCLEIPSDEKVGVIGEFVFVVQSMGAPAA